MATTRSFSDMLNEYLPNRLLKNELLKRSWILDNVQKDNAWAGGKIIVPFKGTQASSLSVGVLTASNDIAEDDFVRGSIDDYVEYWHALKFNHRDLVDHDGKIPEATFIKLVSETVDDAADYFKMHASIGLTTGPHFAKLTGDGQAGGTAVVDKIDRFVIGQKFVLDDGNSSTTTVYVTAVNVNTSTITVSASRGGSAADISAYTVAQGAACYHPGAWDGTTSSNFVSIRSALLSAANGGSSTIHGVTKTAWPFLQAVNVDGSTVTAANFLDKIFDAYTSIQAKARGGRCSTILMSLQNLGVILKLIQIEKGGFHVAPNSTKASEYGWTEIMIGSPAGVMLKIVGIQEMDNDVVYFLDMKSMTFRSKGFFKKRKAPDGREYFEVRDTTGYSYIVDMCLFGELEVTKPGNNGVMYGIALSY
jgi:hypothetical protein